MYKWAEISMTQMPMTTEMTTLHRTSPLVWHCTLSTLTNTSTESEHHERAVLFHVHISSTLTLAQVRALSALHSPPSSRPSMWLLSLRLDFLLLLFGLHFSDDEQQSDLNKKIMENLCDSATNWVRALVTSSSSRTNSSITLSFKIPADQDVDDLTLGKMLTEAYRGQVDHFVQGGVSVGQGRLWPIHFWPILFFCVLLCCGWFCCGLVFCVVVLCVCVVGVFRASPPDPPSAGPPPPPDRLRPTLAKPTLAILV